MCQFRAISAVVLALFIVACDSDLGTEPTVADPTAADPTATAVDGIPSNLSDGTLGTVRYQYDASALTRAEVDLALPPDFDQTVFAIKFIPASLTSQLGEAECSFGSLDEGKECSATAEVGFAIALLERPMADYTTALAQATPSIPRLEPVVVDGHEGMSFVYEAGPTKTRYTFLPADSRTLLLVDRFSDGVELEALALEQVRASIDF